MPTLDAQTVDSFRHRFHSFNDGVLRSLLITYSPNGQRGVEFLIAVQDAEETTTDGWVCVRLRVLNVEEFRFTDHANTNAAVLSNGIHICPFDGLIGLEFGDFADPPQSLMELQSSAFFAVGSSVEWSVEAY